MNSGLAELRAVKARGDLATKLRSLQERFNEVILKGGPAAIAGEIGALIRAQAQAPAEQLALWESVQGHDFVAEMSCVLTPKSKADCEAAQNLRSKVASLLEFYAVHGNPPELNDMIDMRKVPPLAHPSPQ